MSYEDHVVKSEIQVKQSSASRAIKISLQQRKCSSVIMIIEIFFVTKQCWNMGQVKCPVVSIDCYHFQASKNGGFINQVFS